MVSSCGADLYNAIVEISPDSSASSWNELCENTTLQIQVRVDEQGFVTQIFAYPGLNLCFIKDTEDIKIVQGFLDLIGHVGGNIANNCEFQVGNKTSRLDLYGLTSIVEQLRPYVDLINTIIQKNERTKNVTIADFIFIGKYLSEVVKTFLSDQISSRRKIGIADLPKLLSKFTSIPETFFEILVIENAQERTILPDILALSESERIKLLLANVLADRVKKKRS